MGSEFNCQLVEMFTNSYILPWVILVVFPLSSGKGTLSFEEVIKLGGRWAFMLIPGPAFLKELPDWVRNPVGGPLRRFPGPYL